MKTQHHAMSRIMIIDDDERNIAILRELLEDHYRIVWAASGEEGLNKINAFHPDIVLLDIMMPGIDGLEVCRQIRQNRASRFCKILFISGKVTLEDRLAGYKAGGDDYITKPFDHDEIMAKIQVFLQLKSAQEINQIKRDFLNLMAHETHTPLNGILGLADYIMDDNDLKLEEIRPMVQEISDAGQTLMSLIRKILLIVNLSGPVQIDESNEDISEAVGLALDAQKTIAAQRQIQYKPTVEPCQFVHDRDLIIQSLCFVLDNAIQHAPQQSALEVVGQRIGENYRIEILDQGEGISAEDLKYISDEFTVKNIGHHSKGHGLGLAIVKRVAEMHGGTLHIESAPTFGTSVTIELPIRT